MIVTTNSSFANASALYTYLLTEHKKVSLSATEPIKRSFSFLPWFDKCRANQPSTAEFIIDAPCDTQALYDFFVKNEVKINPKMATALYSGLLIEHDGFVSDSCDGTIFALASELIDKKADFSMAKEKLLQTLPLSLFRIKAKLYDSLRLAEDASHAKIFVTQRDLLATGATMLDVKACLDEFLNIVHVKKATLYECDENRKILKKLKEI